jgi:glucosamine-6-phosphate deaminase
MRHLTLGGPDHPVPVSIYETPESLGHTLAAELLTKINAAKAAGRPFLLGCPGGRSLQTTYQALGEQAGQAGADLSHVVIVMMDDYVLPSAQGFAHCPAEAHYSCRRFAWEDIWQVLNTGLPAEKQIRRDHVWFPDPADPAAYDDKLKAAGGIDVFLIASGASDGHVAFNPPGTALSSRTRIIPLAETTRRDNLGTFPEFQTLAEVPGHGVSVGLGTIADLSRQVTLVIHGAHKQAAVRCLAASDDFTPDWPASIIFRCQAPRLLLNEAAAAGLAATKL